MRPPSRRFAWAAGVLVALLLVSLAVPTVRVRFVAATTVADALGWPVWRPLAPAVDRSAANLGGVVGDLYDPHPHAPGIVLVPGATPAGRDDPRVVQLAAAIARAGRAVFVPDLEVYGQDLVRSDVDRIVRAGRALATAERGPVVLLGTSFGGSLCLLAAADPRLDGQVNLVGTFGAYFDLVGVLQAATTGFALIGGEQVEWPADPRAETIVRDRLVDLLPSGLREPVLQAVAGDLDADALPPTARSVHAVLTNDDPSRTFQLAARLPQSIRERIAEVSPASVVDQLVGVPIVAMHTTDDPAVPYSELRRMSTALPHARTITVESFAHVDLEVTSPSQWLAAARDLWRTWQFTRIVLEAQ